MTTRSFSQLRTVVLHLHRNINASSSIGIGGPYEYYSTNNFFCHHRRRRFHASAIIARQGSSSTTTANNPKKSQKDLFTPSPFARSPRINVNEKFAIVRELMEEGADNVYGIRRYLLISRSQEEEEEEDAKYYAENENYSPSTSTNIIASINANRNVLFGARLHHARGIDPSSVMDDGDDYITNYLAACGSLLDVAKIDASINGQQVQALATLNGLCSWVSECLENDGEGSVVLKGLIYGEKGIAPAMMDTMIHNGGSSRSARKGDMSKLPRGKRANQRIETNHESFMTLAVKDEAQRLLLLEAVRAIATGHPRPGHTVVGAGTFRDGRRGWVALAREYAQLAINPNALALDSSYVRRLGLEEVALYRSHEGEVTAIEHLAHTQPEYLREAGGAMARIFFV